MCDFSLMHHHAVTIYTVRFFRSHDAGKEKTSVSERVRLLYNSYPLNTYSGPECRKSQPCEGYELQPAWHEIGKGRFYTTGFG